MAAAVMAVEIAVMAVEIAVMGDNVVMGATAVVGVVMGAAVPTLVAVKEIDQDIELLYRM